MIATDVIGILLDSGAWHWTTVASVTDGTTLELTAGATAANATNRVICYRWKAMANLQA
jgi:hypothetical protein